MMSSAVAGEDAEGGLKSLVEHLRNGPLELLILLQRRANSVTEEALNGEDLIEELESLVSLMMSVMVRFHEFNAELQGVVDRLARELAEHPSPPDPSRLS